MDYVNKPLDEHWIVVNFEKRQRAQTSSERGQLFRQRQRKQQFNVNETIAERKTNVSFVEEEEDIDIDKEVEEKKKQKNSTTFSATFAQESIQEQQARRLLEKVCGVLTPRAAEHFNTVEDLILHYGVEKTEDAIRKARAQWVKTPRQNGSGTYSPTNYGFIDWAVAALSGHDPHAHAELDSYQRLLLELGETKDG